tara:strand:+ start:6384 stop:7262 length:879 start_codon:yes stop_codon:yes gene_type:complete
MSQQITEAFVKQFRDGITLRAQQMESRLRGSVRSETVSGTSASFDFIGSRSPAKRQSRHADTVLSDTPHDRRWVEMSVWDDADLIDKPDLVRTLTDPTNSYTKAMAAGFGRKIDEIIMAGAIGTTKTGVDGAGTEALPAAQIQEADASDDGNKVGLTTMRNAKLKFDQNEQPPNRHWAVTAYQLDHLLSIDQIRSADYNSVKALVQGEVNSFMGFEWHRVENPILTLETSPADRNTVVWVPDAVILAFGADVQASIDRRPDKNNSSQIFYSADFGAARLDDTGVMRIDSLED